MNAVQKQRLIHLATAPWKLSDQEHTELEMLMMLREMSNCI